jgi:NUMOD3 motif
MFYTYAHYTPEGRLFYIGKGKGNRAYNRSRRNTHWKSIVAKYGKPIVEILAEWRTEAHALEHEVQLIAYFRSTGCKLCNKTDGGEGTTGCRPTPEQTEKNRLAHLGKPAWNKGIPCTEHVKAKIRSKLLGRSVGPPSAETRKKLSEAQKGKVVSEETRRKQSEARKGKGTSAKQKAIASMTHKGNKHSLGRTDMRKWLWIGTCLTTGKVIQYAGSGELSNAGFTHAHVIACINGARKLHKGHTWSRERIER